MTGAFSPRAAFRLTLVTAFILAGMCVCTGCSRNDSITLIIRHNAPPEQPQHQTLIYVADLLNERTDGRITMEVTASLTVHAQVETIRAGSREVGMTGAQGIADFYPKFSALEAPYMFRDLDHFYATIRSPFGQRLLEESERVSGLHIIDLWHQGVRQVTLRDNPALGPTEFRTVKLRVPGGMMFVEVAKIFGALPTTMGFESVNMGLRMGIIDGQENPLPTIKAMGFQNHCKYLVLTNHMIGTIMPVINSEYWHSLPEEDREIITQAFRDGGDYNRTIIEAAEQALVSEFAEQGMIVLRPDLTVFRERAERTWVRFHELWGDSTVAEIQAVGLPER